MGGVRRSDRRFDTARAGSNDTIAVGGRWAFTVFTENAAGAKGTHGFANGANVISLTLPGDDNSADFVPQSGPKGSTLIAYA